MENSLRDRIRARLSELGKDQYEVAEEAGLSRTSVWAFLKGDTDSMRRKSLEKLAVALQCDYDYLIGKKELPGAPGARSEPAEPRKQDFAEAQKAQGGSLIRVSGVMSGDVWLKSGLEVSPASAPSDPRYPGATQIALRVMGNRWKDCGIVDGSIVVVADISPREGDLLAVEVERENGERRTQVGKLSNGKIGTIPTAEGSWVLRTIGVIVMENRMF